MSRAIPLLRQSPALQAIDTELIGLTLILGLIVFGSQL